MNDWITIVNYSVAVAAMTLMALGLTIACVNKTMAKDIKRFFVIFFTLGTLYALFDLLELTINAFTKAVLLDQILLFLESLFSSLLMPTMAFFLVQCCGEKWQKSPLMRIILPLWISYFLLLIVTQFTSVIYYYDSENVYHRGPWYPLLLFPPTLIMATNLIGLFRRKGKLSTKQFTAFLIEFTAPLAAMLIQMFAYGLLVIVFATAFSALFLFLFILRDQVDQYIRQQQELSRQRASIMVLQMRPHFIYNTLMSIYCLYKQNAEKAQRMMLDFTSYLRKNFTAIAKEDTISFSEELEHVRAYLAVEQVRFEGKLFVTFDTPVTMFRLPPLTLQPIVENAVKHNIDPELDPLHIHISTAAEEAGFVIAVEDNGPGFSLADDDEPHIALNNIRERLKMMCGGRLDITPRKGGGTVVTVFVPAKRAI